MDKKDGNAPTSLAGKLKYAIFRTFSLTLDHNIINTPIYLLMILLELYQQLPFFYNIALRVADKVPTAMSRYSGFVDTLFTITLNSSLLGTSFTGVLAFSFAFFALLCSIVGLTIYSCGSQGKFQQLIKASQKCSIMLKPFSFLLKSMCTYVTLPAFILMFTSYDCITVNGTAVFRSDGTTKCWEGLHICMVVLNSLNLAFFFIILTVVETMLSENNPRSTLPWASCGTNNIMALKHAAKATLVAFVILDPEASFYHYLFISLLIMYGFTVYWIFLAPSYLNRWVGFFTLYEHAALFFLVMWSYIIRFADNVIDYQEVILITCLFVTMAAIMLFAQDCYDQRVLSQQSSDAKEVSVKEYYFYELFYYLDLYSSGDANIIIKLNGVYMNHQRLCNNPNCACSSNGINAYLESVNKKGHNEYEGRDVAKLQGSEEVERQKSRRWEGMSSLFQVVGSKTNIYDGIEDGGAVSPRDKSVREDEVLVPTNYQLLLNMCASIIDHEVQSDNSCVPMRMISAYYAKEYIGNMFRAVYDLFYIEEKLKPSFHEAFLIYKAKKDIDEEIAIFSQKKAGDNVVDVESLILFEEHYKRFRNYAETGSNYANRFWELLKNKDLDVNGLYDIGSKVGEIYTEMHKSYDVAIDIFPQNHKLVKEFGSYEKYVMNNDALANEYETEAKRIIQEQAEHTNEIENNEIQIIKSTSVHHTAICLASGNPGSMGEILSVNDEVQYSLGLRAKEIIGKNCSVLTPSYIAPKHNAMVESFIRSGTTNFLGALRVVAGCNNKGFLVPLDLIIKILPSIDRGICFVSIFKKFENYGVYFQNAHLQCYPTDFAMIVTNLEGVLLGITETCMTRLGIPVSIFKSGTGDETVTIQSLIKDLNEADAIEEMKGDGRKVEIDTKPFLYSINRENLPANESKYLESNAGKFNVLAKMSVETYTQGIKVQIFRMIIIGDTPLPPAMDSKELPGANTANKHTPSTDTRRESKLGTGRKQTNEEDSDTKRDMMVERNYTELKQNINNKSSGLRVTTMNLWVHILIIVILALASTQFGLLVTEKEQFDFYTDIIATANKRMLHAGLIHSQVMTNVNMTNSTTSTELVLGVNLYEYLREYGFRSIGLLNSAESKINAAQFDYTTALYNIEKKSTIDMYTLGLYSQLTDIVHTLNTAITQYTSKAADFMSYTFAALRTLVASAGATDSISTEYFFIITNGLGSLATATQGAVNEYTSVMKDRIGKYIPYYIGVAIVIGLAVIICFGVIVPKLVGVQNEKIHILLLYTQMSRNEVNAQIEKCVQYQQISGYLEAVEESVKDELGSSEIRSEAEKGENRSIAGGVSKEKILGMESKEEEEVKAKDFEEAPKIIKKMVEDEGSKGENENNDDDDEDEEENEGKEIDENDKTIHETLDTTKLHSKLTTNKFWLFITSFLVSMLFCSYPLVSTVYSWYKAKETREMLDMTNGVAQLMKAPLYLLLYSLVSVTNNSTITINGEDSIDYYLTAFMSAYSFAQTLTSSKGSYMSNVKTLYSALDSSAFCAQLMTLNGVIRSEYTGYDYVYQKTVTEAICNQFESGLLSRGLTQATYLVYQTANKLQTERKAGRTPNTRDAVRTLYMMMMFVAPTIEGMLIDLGDDIQTDLSALMIFVISFYVAFLLGAIITHFLFWTCFFKEMKEEIIKSRGMLKLMPLELIKKLKNRKSTGSDAASLQSLRFFKQIQKKS